MIHIKIKRLSKNTIFPTRNNLTDAAFDLYSIIGVTLKKGERKMIPLGFSTEIEKGYFASVRDRSGIAVKNGIHVMAGVIDAGYRGEWNVVLINLGEKTYKIEKGDRIAQVVLHKVRDIKWEEFEEFSDSDRGEKGFGDSGK